MILSQLHTADPADDGASSEDNLFHAPPLVDDSDPDLVIVDDPARPRIKRGTQCQKTSALHVPDMAVMVEIPEYDLKQHGEFSGLLFNSTGTGAVVVADFAVAGFLLDDDDVKSLCEEGETVVVPGRAGTRGPTSSGGAEAAAAGTAVTGGTDRWDFHLASPDQALGSKHISVHPGSAELQPRTKTGKCLLSYTAKLERRVLKVAWHPRSDAHLAILTADREGNTFWELLDLSKEERTGNGGSLFVERSASWAKADPVVDFAFLGQQQQQPSSSASGATQQLWTATSVVFLQRSGILSSAKVATGSMTFPRNCFSELKQRFHQGTLAQTLTTWSGGDPRDGDENSTKPPSSTGEVVVSEPEIIPVTASGDEMCLVQLANGSRGSSSRAARARGDHPRAKVPEITLELRRLREDPQPIQGPLQDKNKLSRAKQYTQILVVCGNPLPVIAFLEREAIEVCTLTQEQCSTPIDVFEGHECFELKRTLVSINTRRILPEATASDKKNFLVIIFGNQIFSKMNQPYSVLVQQLQIVSKNYVAELIKKNLILKQWLANVGHKMHQHQLQEWGKLREKADEVERNAAELEELTTKLRKRQAELKKELSKIVFGEFGSVGAGDRDQANASPGAAAAAGAVSFTSTGGLVAMVNAEKAKMILDYQLPIRSAAGGVSATGGIGSDPMLYQQQWY
eukprot:g10307.t1